jgi:hypothetical protein
MPAKAFERAVQLGRLPDTVSEKDQFVENT